MNTHDYQAFLATKQFVAKQSGFDVDKSSIHRRLFPFQADIVQWSLRKGRAAIFANTGLGKTAMQIEWARHVVAHTGGRVLIVAPLAVVSQTVEEAKSQDVDIHITRSKGDLRNGVNITNYDIIDKFDADDFVGVVLDESSMLKAYRGATRNLLIDMFRATAYKLCCTATPAPNDVIELGNHSEFLGVMTNVQMCSVFFTHEAKVFQGTTARWRLKGHSQDAFFKWLASWSIALNKPSDLDYSDDGYILPPLSVNMHAMSDNYLPDGMLFFTGNLAATEVGKARRTSITERMETALNLIDDTEQWVIWTGLNEEAKAITKAIEGAVNLEGSMPPEKKVDILTRFTHGDIRVLVTKTSIAGMGINMQRAHNMLFFGLDYSWEGYYQAIRRMWRFGQLNPVNVHIVISQSTQSVYDVVMNKEKEAIKMTTELIAAQRQYTLEELGKLYRDEWRYTTDEKSGKGWRMLLGDSAQRMKELADDSIDISVYSPPFAELYVYSDSPYDLSNSLNLEQFFAQYQFMIQENLRITKPGRLCCVHVQDVKAFENRDGYRGLKPFSSMVAQAYIDAGWIFRSCITIDKNPQIVATRNKDADLLFVTGKRDATDLAPMATDYLLVFRKPGDNAVPVTPYKNGEMTEQNWIDWAHAVWYDIRETDVLNVRQARTDADEKHMCPLQLPLIDRCLKLWSNRDETVFSMFGGIGSEGYEAIRLNRQFIGIELKPEYWKVACQNLALAEQSKTQMTLFDMLPDSESAD